MQINLLLAVVLSLIHATLLFVCDIRSATE